MADRHARAFAPASAAGDFKKLVSALSLLTGIETIVVLKDVCGLDAADARETTLWAAKTLLAGLAVPQS